MSGIAIIVATLLVIVIAFGLIFVLMSRSARASRGGVEPPPEDEGSRQSPPFEGVEDRS